MSKRFYPALVLLAAAVAPAFADDRIEALMEELDRVKQELSELERLREKVRTLEARLEATERRSIATEDDMETVAADAPAMAASEPDIEIGGALRFTGFWTDDNQAIKGKRGESGLDLFRVSAKGSIDDVLLSAEYRFYPFMNTLHHGWIGYRFDNDSQIEFGVTKVPFGLLPYAAHNFWFGVPYYVGMSDDYDLGVKYVWPNGAWNTQLAFFKNSELSSSSNLGRYSFDVVSAGEARNEENNQINARVAYTFGKDTNCSHEVGLSTQWGELYNADTDRRGDKWAAATHLDTRCGRWNFQLELARFDHNPANPVGVAPDRIEIGGFEAVFDVAQTGTLGVANIAYNFPLGGEKIDQLTCYNDYSVLAKDGPGEDSQLNTTGCALGIGPMFIYLDLINANNMIFFGDGSLAGGGNDEWSTRFNVNVGYYW